MEKGRSRQGKSADQMAHEAGEARYSLNNGRASTQPLEKKKDSAWVVVGLLVEKGKQTLGSVRGRELVTFPDYSQVL